MTVQLIDIRLTGSPRTRFWLELFGNSAQFPIANILFEVLREGFADYVRAPDPYTILLASVVQAYWLSRWQTTAHPRRFIGNLIGPAVYTVVEATIEGPRFFSAPHHLAYWGFALVIGALQSFRGDRFGWLASTLRVLEDVVRAGILLAMYTLYEMATHPAQTRSWEAFFTDSSHQFIALATLLLGLSLGLSSLTAQRYLDLLRQTSARLKVYSEWLLGRDLLGKVMDNPAALALARRERAVMFMDIRGFTHWSESRSAEEVVAMLNRYYVVAESVLRQHRAIKFKFSADEVMAVFAEAGDACRAALGLRDETQSMLAGQGLGAGIGLHLGPLGGGLRGSAEVRFYDVIGDTVNTGKRIEGNAGPAEVLASQAIHGSLAEAFRFGPMREVEAKGKDLPLAVYPVESVAG